MYWYVCSHKYIVVTRCILNSSSRLGSVKILKAGVPGSTFHPPVFIFVFPQSPKWGTYKKGSTGIFAAERTAFRVSFCLFRVP